MLDYSGVSFSVYVDVCEREGDETLQFNKQLESSLWLIILLPKYLEYL